MSVLLLSIPWRNHYVRMRRGFGMINLIDQLKQLGQKSISSNRINCLVSLKFLRRCSWADPHIIVDGHISLLRKLVRTRLFFKRSQSTVSPSGPLLSSLIQLPGKIKKVYTLDERIYTFSFKINRISSCFVSQASRLCR